MTIQLYDYQEKLVSKTRKAYIDGYKAPCIVAPCGAGKSIMIAEVAKMTTEKGNRVLFLVHRKELLDQIQETFKTVGVNFDLVTFGMVMTIVNKLDQLPKPSLIITDENHHGLAASYKKIYNYYSDVLRLGFTATPIRLNGSGLGDVNDLLIEEVSVSWLIEHKRLAPYEYYAPKLIDTNELKKAATGDFTKKSMDKAVGNTIYGDVIKHYESLAKNEQAIAYCHSIEASKHTAEIFNQAGYKAAHIDAKTPKIERESIIQQFRDREIKILCNVDLIGEGFDVPDCTTVIMLRPTKSLSLFVQQAMRGMRYRPNKTSIIIDHVGNVNQFGLPDTERKWTLAAKKKTNAGSDITVVQCKKCFGAYEQNIERLCPYCGFKQPVETKESTLKKDEAKDLEKVNKSDFKIVMDFRNPEDCRSLKELQELAKNRGYKPGWAWYQAKVHGLIN